MIVVMGGKGHVGAAVVGSLAAQGVTTIIVTHKNERENGDDGVIKADVTDTDALRAAFRRGRRAFILNPPADVSLDSDAIERRSAASILAALEQSNLEKIVMASTMGAQPGERLGDLGVLWELE